MNDSRIASKPPRPPETTDGRTYIVTNGSAMNESPSVGKSRIMAAIASPKMPMPATNMLPAREPNAVMPSPKLAVPRCQAASAIPNIITPHHRLATTMSARNSRYAPTSIAMNPPDQCSGLPCPIAAATQTAISTAAIGHGNPEHWSGGFIAMLVGAYLLFLALIVVASLWCGVMMFGMADAAWQ